MNKINVEVTTEKQRNELIEQLKSMQFKKELPKTFEDLEKVSGFFIDNCSSIVTMSDVDVSKDSWNLKANYNIFKTEKQAEKSIAMSKLSQAMAVYNDGWMADWNDSSQLKYTIVRVKDEILITMTNVSYIFMSFKDRETATEFLKNFKKDIEIFFEM